MKGDLGKLDVHVGEDTVHVTIVEEREVYSWPAHRYVLPRVRAGVYFLEREEGPVLVVTAKWLGSTYGVEALIPDWLAHVLAPRTWRCLQEIRRGEQHE